MTTDRDTHEPPELAADAAVDASQPDPQPDHTTATAGASQPHDEAAMRAWEGLPPDTMILAPAFATPPMRCPDDVWAMLVTAVDILGDADPDRAGEVALFAGNWVPQQPPADSLYDGDLVLRLSRPADPTYPLPRDHATDVEMLLAYQGRWQRVGQWRGLDDGWPSLIAPTAAAVMGLHGDATEAAIWSETPPPSTSPPLIKWARGGIAELLDAGLVTAGRGTGLEPPQPRCPAHRPRPGRRHPHPRRRPGVRQSVRCHHRTGWQPPERLERVPARIRRAHIG